MEKFKYDLNMEEVGLSTKSTVCFEKVCFLAKYDLQINESIEQATKELHEWPSKLTGCLEEAADKHH